MGQDFWNIVTGDEPEPDVDPTKSDTLKEQKSWNRRANQAFHFISISVTSANLCHIQPADTPKQAWDSVAKVYESSNKAHRLQLKKQLLQVKKGFLSINDYILHIRGLVEQLSSINEKELIPLLVNEESKLATNLSSSKTEQVLNARRVKERGRFSRGDYNSGRFDQQGRDQSPSTNNTTQPQQQQQQGNARGRGSYRRRGDFQGRGGSQIVCNYCGIRGNIARDCFKKQNDIRSGVLPQSNYVTTEQPQRSDHLFSVSHVMGSMSTASTEEEWYINSGAFNHMTAHEEWFTNMETVKQPGVVITRDDTSHPITHGKTWVYFLKAKSDALKAFKDFKN
ncbi:hypothetical protein AXG93_2376s1030 [Marchantia polymorpha subsp. ruderalis]|uniref:Retrovirus-related Pol polyprotein from transposon TNT 1-94-like beta-barrel domain-containing protein n=1 Tax=Marchantia polymorpha subsp. ruderalis TaxID=1480154 RepID=A0A176VC59_MARPO|nr:hypothetical protein AXG93_2376s1030 [Marchantia polymorpha subsp. ruderalis]